MVINQLKKIQSEYKGKLEEIKSADDLENFRVEYLGRKGHLLTLSKQFKELAPENKPEAGKLLNEVKTEVEKAYKSKSSELGSGEEVSDTKDVDLSLPGRGHRPGHLHPMTQMNRKMSALFRQMGFQYVEGPHVSTINHEFDSTNFPKDHPARDSMDTFILDVKDPNETVIVRPHLSSIVVRQLKEQGAPLKIFFNGPCFRNENVDAKHSHTFYQMEAWIIDEKEASFANAKYLMKQVLKTIFDQDVELRIRTGFFPFVEPGFEGDFKCVLCKGKGCKTCGYEGWIELFPGGPIHPNVLKEGGVDPKKYEGVAINFGWDRMAMLAHQINDIRHILGGDLRFIRQF